eukprot:Ihof_evm2s654 gene=Ihof_evmTU2s654
MTTSVQTAVRCLTVNVYLNAVYKKLFHRGYVTIACKKLCPPDRKRTQRSFWTTPVPKSNITKSKSTPIAFGSSILNRRESNEDRFSLNNLTPDLEYFAVFDGHGGELTSDYAAKNLHKLVYNEIKSGHNYKDSLTRAFIKLDHDFVSLPSKPKCGTTAAVALIHRNIVVVAHVGDSRAIILHKGSPLALTTDHKPHLEKEKRRIEEAGGEVTYDISPYGTVARVNDRLAMSRAIGDVDMKKYGVIAEPDVYEHIRSDT